MTSPWNASTVSLALLLPLALPALLAGCFGGGSFEEPLPEWDAGYRWEYVAQWRESASKGEGSTFPDFLEELASQEPTMDVSNSTIRIDIFNTTAMSQDNVSLYVGAKLSTNGAPPPVDGGGQPATPTGSWSPALFTRSNLNPVDFGSADWSTGTITLRSDFQDTDGQERKNFQFPLKKGKTWQQFGRTCSNEYEDKGKAEYRVVTKETRNVAAGSFDSVRVSGRFIPQDAADFKEELRSYFIYYGATLDQFEVQRELQCTYYFAPRAKAIVDRLDADITYIAAKGKDSNGKTFGFNVRYLEENAMSLLRFELTAGLERPVAFMSQILAGQYEPPAITPLADHVAEVVVSVPALNAAAENPKVDFRLRDFNTTLGETYLRDHANGSKFALVHAGTTLDSRLAANWSFAYETPAGWIPLAGTYTDSVVQLTAEQLHGPGLKQATLTFTSRENGIKISEDVAYFEILWRNNNSVTASEANVTDRYVETFFPVAYGAQTLEINAQIDDSTGHPFGRLRVFDGSNILLQGQSSSSRYFSDNVGERPPGTWRTTHDDGPVVPVVGTRYTFDIEVRYRGERDN